MTTLFHPSNHQGLLYPYNKLEHVDDDVHGSIRSHMVVSLKSIHQWLSCPLEKWNEINILSWLVLEHLQAPAGAQHVWPCNNISHIQVYSCLFFLDNPTHKTKTGITNRWETTNSKAPGPIMDKVQKVGFITLLSDRCC